MADFRNMQMAAWSHAEEKGFHKAQRQMSQDVAGVWVRLMLIVTEAAEAAEALRETSPSHVWLETYDGDEVTVLNREQLRDGAARGMKPGGFLSEVADIVIRCMDCCEDLGLDLATMIEAKQTYNQTRDHMHGGKQA